MTAASKIAPPVCAHKEFTVLRHFSDHLEDHDTIDAQCRTCGQLIVVTCFANGENDYSVMDAGYARREGYLKAVAPRSLGSYIEEGTWAAQVQRDELRRWG